MIIRIERVLRDYNKNQCAVTALIDGERCAYVPLRQLKQYIDRGAVCENFIFTRAGVKGKECNLEFREYLTQDQIWERYPDKYVIVGDWSANPQSLLGTLVSGVVLRVFDRRDVAKCNKYRDNINYRIECTIDPIRDSLARLI